jgi:hypothetical protein
MAHDAHHGRHARQTKRDQNEPAFLCAVEALFCDRTKAMIRRDWKDNEKASQNDPAEIILVRHSLGWMLSSWPRSSVARFESRCSKFARASSASFP